MSPLWQRVLNGDPEIRASFDKELDDRVRALQVYAAESSTNWDSVLSTRGAITELRRLQGLLNSEVEINARRTASNVRSIDRSGKPARS